MQHTQSPNYGRDPVNRQAEGLHCDGLLVGKGKVASSSFEVTILLRDLDKILSLGQSRVRSMDSNRLDFLCLRAE